jgi:threonine dehydrogenase-like Zn-dependent dehydrogenase
MQAILWDGTDYPDCLSMTQVEAQGPPPGWVLVRNRAAGICGSDLHLILGHTRYLVPPGMYPVVLGHENAGIVLEVGEGVEQVKPGDRVAIQPGHSCRLFGESCPACRVGRYHICPRLTFVGLPFVRQLHGGFGEYSIAHESCVVHVPDNVSLEIAATLDILGVSVHAMKIGRPGVGDTVVVYGCGLSGLETIQCLVAEGVRDLIAVAKHDYQGDMARRFGAREIIVLGDGVDPVAEVFKLTSGWGADQVYECVGGFSDAVDQSTRMLCPGGKVIMIGGASRPAPIDLQTMILRETSILASMAYSTYGVKSEAQIAMDMLRDGVIDNAPLITHTCSPEEYRRAFDLAVNKGGSRAFKVMFVRE